MEDDRHRSGSSLSPGAVATALTAATSTATGALLALRGTSNAWVGALGIAAAPMLMVARREVLVYLCIGSVYFLDWLSLTLGVLPPQTAWFLEACVAVLVIRSALDAYRSGGRRVPTMLIVLVGAILFEAALAVLLGLSPVVAILGLRKYLLFPLIAISIILVPLGDGFSRRLWVCLLSVGLLQVGVSAIQVLTVGPGNHVTGTFGPGGTGLSAIFLTALTVSVILHRLVVSGHIRARDVAVGVLLMLPTVFGSAVVTFVLLPAGLVFGVLMYGRSLARVARTVLVAGLIFAVLVPYAMDYVESVGYVEPERLLSSTQALVEYDRRTTAVGLLGRMDQLILAHQLTIGDDPLAALVGHGPASASVSSLGTQYGGPLLRYPLVRLVETSLAVSLIELGLLGLGVMIAVFAYGIRVSVRGVPTRRESRSSPLHVFLGVSGFMMLVTAAYSGPWFQPVTAIAYWTALAAVLTFHSGSAVNDSE